MLSNSYVAQYGRSVTLECVVDSYPPHTDVTWYRIDDDGTRTAVVMNNGKKGSTVDSPSLVINKAQFDDDGLYICTAENAAGVGSSDDTYFSVYGGMYSNFEKKNMLLQIKLLTDTQIRLDLSNSDSQKVGCDLHQLINN